MPSSAKGTFLDDPVPPYKLVDPRLSARLAQINILIIDPDKRVADLLRKVLISLGFGGIFLARDGAEGLRILHNKPIDLAITDWDMEPMNGLSFIDHIRTSKNSPNRQLPIVMLTGKAQRRHVETARDVGMTEFVVKPFSVRTLCDRIILVIEHPRNFILAGTYVGPDRRRRSGPPPADAAERRINPDDRAAIVSEDKRSKVLRAGDQEVTIMKPSQTLKDKVGHDISLDDILSVSSVRKAQQIISGAQGDFLEWIIQDTRAMEQAFHRIGHTAAGKPQDIRALYQAALTIKAQAGTFGFDLASQVAESLMLVLEDLTYADPQCMVVLRKHMDALYVIFQRNIQGMGGAIGKELLASLDKLGKKYLD